MDTITAFVIEAHDGYTTAGRALALGMDIERFTDVRVNDVRQVDFADVGFNTHWALTIDAPYRELKPYIAGALRLHGMQIEGSMQVTP